MLGGCIGTGMGCRYSGLEGHQEAPRGVGAIRGALGLAGSVGAQGPAGYRGFYGVSGDIGVMRGCQGSIGAWQGV